MLDYRTALYLWVSSGLFDEIEYIDGSGASIIAAVERLARLRGIQLSETLLDVSQAAKQFGKGRAEALLLRDAVSRTKGTFFKATGRLFVTNAHRLIVEVQGGRRSRFLDHGTADTRFFAADSNWFRDTLDPLTEEIYDGSPSNCIEAVDERAPGWESFSELPRYYGVNATTGQPLS